MESWAERVYAGVLGKIVGVYLGRPFEQWTNADIEERLGEITGYVTGHPAIEPAKRDNPLVVTDDDISGTFTFLRALEDYGADVTTEQIGQTWLNYILEERSTHWWGGVGVSAEHTAYLRLKDGLPGGRQSDVLSEQIGAQIFIDGWAMACPGDPERAADLARRAACVSHGRRGRVRGAGRRRDGGAGVRRGRTSARCSTPALSLIPRDSVIARVIDDVRGWHVADGDWRRTRERIEERYGYHRYRGVCHVVPNHALIVLGLLYGDGDFDRSLMVVNTAGWDTDCNSGNLGCLLGIRGGVEAIGPRLARAGARPHVPVERRRRPGDHRRRHRGRPRHQRRRRGTQWRPPRFHFSFPGSVQGFDAAARGRRARAWTASPRRRPSSRARRSA